MCYVDVVLMIVIITYKYLIQLNIYTNYYINTLDISKKKEEHKNRAIYKLNILHGSGCFFFFSRMEFSGWKW